MEQQIICLPKNTLSKQQKAAITKRGHIVIECDEPEKVRVISPEYDVNEFFMAALSACTTSVPSGRAEIFVNELYRRLQKKEVK